MLAGRSGDDEHSFVYSGFCFCVAFKAASFHRGEAGVRYQGISDSVSLVIQWAERTWLVRPSTWVGNYLTVPIQADRNDKSERDEKKRDKEKMRDS